MEHDLLPKDTHVPVCMTETSVEVSRGGEEFFLGAALWEFIASHQKVLYKENSVLMSWHSGMFQGWGVLLVLLLACA